MELPQVLISTDPVDGACQLHQSECSPLPGSVSSVVAAPLCPTAETCAPVSCAASAKSSLLGVSTARRNEPIAPSWPSTAMRFSVPEVAWKLTRARCEQVPGASSDDATSVSVPALTV